MVSPTSTISIPADEQKHSIELKPLPIGLASSAVRSAVMAQADTSTPAGNAPKAMVSTPPKGPSGVMEEIPEIPRWRFIAIVISLMLSTFLFALDQLIVATAIPKITAEFNSLTQLSWLATGFFLTLLSFNLIYSQFLNIFPSKHVIIAADIIFEIGSVVCGAASNMKVLILGRAIAGVGGAGIFSGAMVIAAELVPLSKRGQYFALFGVCFAVASVLGPLVGGAFADHVSWRWCFYINLPFGGIAIPSLFFFMPTRAPLGRSQSYEGYSKKMFGQVLKLDWVGVILSMAWAVSLIMATEWGGVTKKWNSASVVVCLVLTGVLPPIFVLYEWYMKDNASFRTSLIKRRTIGAACIVSFCVFGVFMILVYYLSLTYQAVHHTSATGAGVRLLPLILVQIAVLITSSRLIPLIGRFKPVIVCGPIFLSIASGLFYSINYSTSVAHLYGYQVILGFGIGMCLQNTMVAVQHELRDQPKLVSLGTGLTVFTGLMGRIIGLSVAGSVFENMIQRNLRSSVPGITDEIISAVVNDAAAVWTTVPDDIRVPVLEAYTKTLSVVFVIALPLSIIAFGGALMLRNDRMVSKEDEAKAAAKAKAEREAAEAKVGDEEAVIESGSASRAASLHRNDDVARG